MFALSLVDTLRMTFGHVVQHHKAHSEAARVFVRSGRWFRSAEALLMLGVVIAAINAAAGKGYVYTVACAALASVALALFLIHAMFDFDASARAHHVVATRLWHLREQYRALLSDLKDEAVDMESARRRRNALMDELHDVYQSAPPLRRKPYSRASGESDIAEEVALADSEIDRFLPKSLHGVKKSA